jgi:hypothetical protein
MKTMTKTIVSSLLAFGLSAGIAFAQAPAAPATTAPAVAKPAMPAPAAPAATVAKPAAKVAGVPKTASTPEGVECSKQADAKNLHGKERVKFRAKCKSDLKKAAKAGGATAAPAAMPAKKVN